MPFCWFLRGLEPCQAVGGLGPSKNNQSLIPNIPDSTNVSLHMLGMTADHCRSWEKRHVPDSPDFSLTLQSNHGYLQFWVFFCQKNLAKSGGVHHSPGFAWLWPWILTFQHFEPLFGPKIRGRPGPPWIHQCTVTPTVNCSFRFAK